jgi:type I restriction enzyme S subunit
MNKEPLTIEEASSTYQLTAENHSLPKGYKQTEVGVIPDDWGVVPITKVTVQIFLGLTSTVDYVDQGGVPLIRATDIAGGRLSFTNAKTISIIQHKKLTRYRIAKRGDVLVSKSGSLGVCALVDVDQEFSIYESIIVLQPSINLYPQYLLNLLRHEATQDRIMGGKVGSGVSHLNLEMFRGLIVPLPPTKTEQTAIATALSDVDALLTKLDQLIAKKRDLKQAAMQQLLTGQTRLLGFSDNTNYKKTEIGLIPEDWEICQVGSLADYTNGKAHEQSITDCGHYIVVNSKFISTEGRVLKYSDECLCPAKLGDVLMVMSDVPNGRAIAKCFYVEEGNLYTVNQRICMLSSNKVDAKLLFYKLNRNKFYLSFDDGAKQTNLRKDDVLSCLIAIPVSQNEQSAIGKALSDIDDEIAALETRRDKTRDIKQGMMQELLTGRIRLI